MKASLILNQNDEIAFLYGESLGFKPEWAAIDVERGELYVYSPESEERALNLDKIDQSIYDRVYKEGKILLVEVENNDATKPIEAVWVSLMVSTQYK